MRLWARSVWEALRKERPTVHTTGITKAHSVGCAQLHYAPCWGFIIAKLRASRGTKMIMEANLIWKCATVA